MASRNRKIKREKSSSPSSESSDDSPPPPPPKKQRQQLIIKKPKPEVICITSSSGSDSDSEEVHQQVKNNNHGMAAAKANNNKVSHANVGKNTTAAAANTNSSAKALVRALYEKPKQRDGKAIKQSVDSDSDSDSDEQSEDRQKRPSSSNSNSISAKVLPKDMYNFCKFILESGEQKEIYLTGKKATCRFATLVGNMPNLDPNIDVAAMQSSFNQMYRWATNVSEVSLVDALKRVMDYVQGEQVLHKYPGFLRKAASSWNIYVKQQGVLPNASGKLMAKYKNKQDKGVIAAEEEFKRSKENHVTQMKEFMERYKDQLFQSQIDALQKKIRKLEKENGKKEPKPKGPQVKRAMPEAPAKPTSYELYKNTAEKDPKYAHLPDEDKEAILLSRFNKLPNQQKQMYESIAENYQL